MTKTYLENFPDLFSNHNTKCTPPHVQVEIIAMNDGDIKDGGRLLKINFDFTASRLGDLLVATSQQGVCHIAFFEDEEMALAELKNCFPNAQFRKSKDHYFLEALDLLEGHAQDAHIKLHLNATAFQIRVWEELLKIPFGALATYGCIAEKLGDAKAARAVGTAIGSNKIAYLIPCHRVVQKSGKLGGFKWGIPVKTRLLKWEADEINNCYV